MRSNFALQCRKAAAFYTVKAALHSQTDSEPIFGWRGCDEALFSEKGVFSEKGRGYSVNRRFGKDFYSKGNSVKRFGPCTEPPDSENWKVAVLIPFPKISSYWHVCSVVLESGNASEAFLQTPTPTLGKKTPGPMDARFFIQCWAGMWHLYRKNTTLPNTRTG